MRELRRVRDGGVLRSVRADKEGALIDAIQVALPSEGDVKERLGGVFREKVRERAEAQGCVVAIEVPQGQLRQVYQGTVEGDTENALPYPADICSLCGVSRVPSRGFFLTRTSLTLKNAVVGLSGTPCRTLRSYTPCEGIV